MTASAKSQSALDYHAELDAIDRETVRLNASSTDEGEWNQWENWTTRIWREIEALPSTPDNAILKARAVWSITDGKMEDLNEGQSTCCRLVRQIIEGLGSKRP